MGDEAVHGEQDADGVQAQDQGGAQGGAGGAQERQEAHRAAAQMHQDPVQGRRARQARHPQNLPEELRQARGAGTGPCLAETERRGVAECWRAADIGRPGGCTCE